MADRFIGDGKLTFSQLVSLFKLKIMPPGSVLYSNGKVEYPYEPSPQYEINDRNANSMRKFLEDLRDFDDEELSEYDDEGRIEWDGDFCGND